MQNFPACPQHPVAGWLSHGQASARRVLEGQRCGTTGEEKVVGTFYGCTGEGMWFCWHVHTHIHIHIKLIFPLSLSLFRCYYLEDTRLSHA